MAYPLSVCEDQVDVALEFPPRTLTPTTAGVTLPEDAVGRSRIFAGMISFFEPLALGSCFFASRHFHVVIDEAG